jgi:hypothetical protein
MLDGFPDLTGGCVGGVATDALPPVSFLALLCHYLLGGGASLQTSCATSSDPVAFPMAGRGRRRRTGVGLAGRCGGDRVKAGNQRRGAEDPREGQRERELTVEHDVFSMVHPNSAWLRTGMAA